MFKLLVFLRKENNLLFQNKMKPSYPPFLKMSILALRIGWMRPMGKNTWLQVAPLVTWGRPCSALWTTRVFILPPGKFLQFPGSLAQRTTLPSPPQFVLWELLPLQERKGPACAWMPLQDKGPADFQCYHFWITVSHCRPEAGTSCSERSALPQNAPSSLESLCMGQEGAGSARISFQGLNAFFLFWLEGASAKEPP